jgi:hypothetical protein
MAVAFDPDQIVAVFNADPEFQLAARFWTGTLEFGVGDNLYKLELDEGKVTDARLTLSTDLSDDDRRNGSRRVRIGAPEHDWEQIVQDPAPPFYLDYYSASVHHDVTLDGDPETLWAYYPAIRRTTDLFRQIVNTGEGS